MKNLLIIISISVIFIFTAFTWKANTTTDILCGTEFKAWKLQSISDYSPSCVIPNAFTEDNKYIFYRNGDFVFDPGQIRSSGDSACTDPYPYTSKWMFGSNESNLIITTTYLDSSGAVNEEEVFNVQMEIINENQIKFKEFSDSLLIESVLVAW